MKTRSLSIVADLVGIALILSYSCAGHAQGYPVYLALAYQNTPYSGPNVVTPAPGPPVRKQQFDPVTGRPCGGYMMAPCKAADVSIPAGATGEQVFQMGMQAQAAHQPPNVVIGYFEKSAQMGYVRAQAAIGEDYLNGKGEPKDAKQALHWLDLAAKQNSRAAQDLMGEFYEDGKVVPQDQVEAVRYFRLSAAQHYAPAELDLGLAYELGHGVVRSRAQAIEFLKRAAADGHDQIAANYASALSRAPASTHFTSESQIAAFTNAPVQPSNSQSGTYQKCDLIEGCKTYYCPDLLANGNVSVYFHLHQGCTHVHVRGMNPGDAGFEWYLHADGTVSMQK